MELRQANPARSPPIQTTGTGTSRGPFVPSQSTGTTTLARQFTGINGGDPSVLRQLTKILSRSQWRGACSLPELIDIGAADLDPLMQGNTSLMRVAALGLEEVNR